MLHQELKDKIIELGNYSYDSLLPEIVKTITDKPHEDFVWDSYLARKGEDYFVQIDCGDFFLEVTLETTNGLDYYLTDNSSCSVKINVHNENHVGYYTSYLPVFPVVSDLCLSLQDKMNCDVTRIAFRGLLGKSKVIVS